MSVVHHDGGDLTRACLMRAGQFSDMSAKAAQLLALGCYDPRRPRPHESTTPGEDQC